MFLFFDNFINSLKTRNVEKEKNVIMCLNIDIEPGAFSRKGEVHFIRLGKSLD